MPVPQAKLDALAALHKEVILGRVLNELSNWRCGNI